MSNESKVRWSLRAIVGASVLAGILICSACDGYTSEDRQDRLNAERAERGPEPQFPPSTPTTSRGLDDATWDRLTGASSVAGSTSEDSPGWDADSQGNRRYDPDAFDPNTDGNGHDDGGTPVNGPDSTYHDGLPCYLDFPDFDSLTDEQRNSAHRRYCEPVA